jgi:hypothetical protein
MHERRLRGTRYLLRALFLRGLLADVRVGRCRLTVSNPLLKAPMVSALEAKL